MAIEWKHVVHTKREVPEDSWKGIVEITPIMNIFIVLFFIQYKQALRGGC